MRGLMRGARLRKIGYRKTLIKTKQDYEIISTLYEKYKL